MTEFKNRSSKKWRVRPECTNPVCLIIYKRCFFGDTIYSHLSIGTLSQALDRLSHQLLGVPLPYVYTTHILPDFTTMKNSINSNLVYATLYTKLSPLVAPSIFYTIVLDREK